MTNRFSRKTAHFLRTYSLWIFFLLFLFACLRLVEHLRMAVQVPEANSGTSFFYGLLNDESFTLSICFLLFVPLLLLWSWRPRAAGIAFTFIGSFVLLAAAALSRYYLTTKTLLGADLFGYSLTDIRTTVGSSTSFGFTDLLPLLLLLLFLIALWQARKKSWQLPAAVAVIFLITGLASTFRYNAFAAKSNTPAGMLSLSKAAWFVSANLSARNQPASLHHFEGYPLLHTDNSTDALTPYLNTGTEKPNFVFLIVEGLGRDFTGPFAQYGGFTPFLDSLSQQGLYWSNFLSSAGRSFAGLPSILGSLPYGENGFNELGQRMPDHQSLISLLKENGYRTSFFYGGNANFDKQDVFLEKEGIDFILDENKFGPGYSRNFGSKYSWGYADADLYRRSLALLCDKHEQPLLNVYFTLSTHEPFALPNEALYEQKIAARLAQFPAADKERYQPYKDVWKSLLYSDESIRSFLAAYSQRSDYANTIFVITGDHRLIPVPEQNALSRFHVPMLIYSPLIKQPKVFPALSSHLDIVPSLVQWLRHDTALHFPAQVHWMGKGLDTAQTFNKAYEMPFMRSKNVLDDWISGEYFLSGNELYRIGQNLQVEAVDDNTLRARLTEKLDSFRQVNRYVCNQDKLLKPGAAASSAKSVVAFSAAEQKAIDSLSGGFTQPDSLFAKARRLAFAGAYEAARLLCRRVLVESPNYHDVRVLYGRTYAWDKKYAQAAPAFAEVVRRNPGYEDAYLAWIDAETWAGKKDSALLLAQKGLAALPESVSLQEKKKKLLAKQ